MLRRLLDALLDCAVASFALWTLLYCLGLATQWSLFPSGWLWLAASVALVVWQVAALVRRHPGADPGVGPGARVSRRGATPAPVALFVVGLVATLVAAVGGIVWTSGTFRFTWLATVVAIGCLLAWSFRDGRYDPSTVEHEAPASARDDLVVLGVMAMTVVASLLVHLADTDDPYYVNRSVWVAEHGNAAMLDTMFSPEVLNSPYGGGVPIASIESLLGVIAHMTGLRAGTVTYLLATPVFTALSVWAIWRLVRRWAPRRAVWVLVAAIAFLMLSGDSMLGNFWIVRMWQGKVMAVTFLMPLIWAYLTELHDAASSDRVGARTLRLRTLLLLLASGVAFFGFTPTAVIWGPVMFGVVVLAAAALGSRTLLLGGGLMVTGPIVSGLAVIAFSAEAVGGTDPTALSARASFVRMLGEAPLMVALALVSLAVAPLLARRGVAGVLAGASALVGVVVYAPGVLDLINAVTGSGPILWRMLYVAPVPVLVGLLVALPWGQGDRPGPGPAEDERRSTVQRAGAVAGLAALLVGFVGGHPVWAHTGHGGPVTVSSRPEWKLDLESLDDVELLARHDISGTVLLPPRRMKVLTMYTTKAFPVVPREWFIQNMDEPRASTEARRLLYEVAGGEGPFPSEGNVRKALEQLDVTLACVGKSEDAQRVVELYEAAGYRDREAIGSLTCLWAPRAADS